MEGFKIGMLVNIWIALLLVSYNLNKIIHLIESAHQ